MKLLGFDIGGTKCAAICAEWNGEAVKIINRVCLPTAADLPATEMIERLIAAADGIIDFVPDGIGISCGGPLDSSRGVILSPPNLPGWDNVPIVDMITEHYGVPTVLCNDANACALAEYRFGNGRGYENIVFLTFGTGLGAGLILGGRLYSGANGNAGEVGHIRLADNGPIGYGKRGSFEGFCSGGGISRLAYGMGMGEKSTKELAELAYGGDECAIEVFRTSARRLGEGLSVIIDVLNPDAIIIGSVYTRCESLFRDEMMRVIEREALGESLAVCKILPAALGDAVGDLAAIAVAIGAKEDV